MRLNIEHKTWYAYEQQVKLSTQYLRLTPQNSVHQQVLSWQLDLPCEATRTLDAYGNVLHVLTLDRPHQLLEIAARGVVEILDASELAPDPQSTLSPLVFLRATPLTQPDGAIRDFARRYWQAEKPLASLEKLMDELLLKMPYQPGSTQVSDSAAKVFAAGSGVCQDHSHVFSPAVAAWGSRRATSVAICILTTLNTLLLTPGLKPGWMAVGTALISPTIRAVRASIYVWRWVWIISMLVRCAVCGWAAAVRICWRWPRCSRCMRSSDIFCRRDYDLLCGNAFIVRDDFCIGLTHQRGRRSYFLVP